jgi:hypothetical protein
VLYTNSAVSLQFGTAGTVKATLDSSGNLGLGVTPSAWKSNYKASQVGNATAVVGRTDINNNYFSSNWYVNSSNQDIYINSGYATLYSQGTGTHAWYTAPSGTAGNAITFTQAMTLDASGNLLVGTTSVLGIGLLSVLGTSSTNVAWFKSVSNTADAVAIQATTASSGTYYMMAFRTGGTGSGTQVGSITATSSVTLYNTTSDQKLKENIVDAPEFGSVIDSIKVRSYDWKADGNHQRAGFIAQELVTVVPEAVHQPADPEEMMAVDYSKLVPMLVKEIQDLRKRLAALEAK